jgi:hypothetical protein
MIKSIQHSVPTLLLTATLAAAASSVAIKHPIVPVADEQHAFVSAPFCTGPGELVRGVYDISSGAPITLLTPPITPIPDVPGSCFETPIAIASGLGGFNPGFIYLAYPDVLNPNVAHIGKIPQTGGPVITPVVDLPLTTFGNQFLMLRFDGVGTFGFNLIAFTGGGELFLINSAGVVVLHKTPSDMGLPPNNPLIEFESPRVAPLTFGPFGGFLFITNENQNQVFAISPVTFKAFQLPNINTAPLPPPNGAEDFVFFPPTQCKFRGSATLLQAVYEGPLGSPGAANAGQVAFIDTSAFSIFDGLVISEDHGYAFLFDASAKLVIPAPYPPAGSFLEHLNPVTPRTDTGSCKITQGCTLTQGGYKNNFNSKLLNFPPGGLFLGTNFYTNSQLNDIIQNNAIKGNGLLSLAHQLITAQLNIFYGAQATPDVALAIVQANALIGSLLIPPVGTDSLPTSTTSTVEGILDTFNNGNSAGGPPHCN